jgi:hypothetical protein
MKTRLVLPAAICVLLVLAVFLMLPRLGGPELPPMPDTAQTLERQDLAPVLRRRIEAALAEQGLNTTPRTLITVAPGDCPAACNAGMDRGLCYCTRDAERNCPAGWPLERGDSRSACVGLPVQLRLRPDGPETPEMTISF